LPPDVSHSLISFVERGSLPFARADVEQTTMIRFRACLIVLMLSAGTVVDAGPIVTFTTTGSANDWTLDFSVTNDLGVADMVVYFVALQLPARNIAGSPGSWNPDVWLSFPSPNLPISYNNNWHINHLNPAAVGNGETLSGFQVKVTTAVAPLFANYLLYASSPSGQPYTGSDYFNSRTNPGFEGVASVAAVPESGALLSVAVGTIVLAVACALFIRQR
jgi:hypothetical protein